MRWGGTRAPAQRYEECAEAKKGSSPGGTLAAAQCYLLVGHGAAWRPPDNSPQLDCRQRALTTRLSHWMRRHPPCQDRGLESPDSGARDRRGSGGVSNHVSRQAVSGEKDKVGSTMVQESLTRQPSEHAPVVPPQALGLDVQAHLGRQLRAVFDDLARQPVPDRFTALLDALERKTGETHAEPAVPIAGVASPGKKAGDA